MDTNATISHFWKHDSIDAAESSLAYLEQNPLLPDSYIGGSFTPSSTSTSTSTSAASPKISVYNPKTGRLFAKIPDSNASDVDAAVAAAEKAFLTWSKTTRAQRAAYLHRIAQLISEHREVLAVWESIDQGKTIERARIEIDRAVTNFTYFANYIFQDDVPARFTDDGTLTYEHRSPAGVFALISPWNMPLYLLTWKIAPCLAFGCTAVAKPSEVTSISAYLLAHIVQQAKLPLGVLNIIFGAGQTTGAYLTTHPKVKGISFTGGTATGIAIRQATASQIHKHLSLELGGKNPTIVFDDVDLDKAVALAARAGFENQGEICLCGSRIYVHASIYEGFLSRFVEFVGKNYVQGKTLGAVVSLQHYQKVRSYIQLAEHESAMFHLGAVPVETPEGGYWIEPTILTGVKQSSKIVQEEIFGPVVTITPFETEEEVVAMANDNPNGLASVLLTKDGARMRRVGEQIDAGLVWVNCWLVRELGTAFGGMKASGVGREGGRYSRDVFTNIRTLHIPQV